MTIHPRWGLRSTRRRGVLGSRTRSGRVRRSRSWWTTRRDGRRSARRCRSSWRGCTTRVSGPRTSRSASGSGRHHAVDAEAMRRRVGDAVADAYRCFSPPVDDLSAYVDLGDDARGRSRPGLPAGGRGRPADPDRLGPAAPPGGVRRRIQADLPGHEPPDRRWGRCTGRGSRRRRRGRLARRRRGRQPDAAGDPRGGGDGSGPCVSISHLLGAPGAGPPRSPPGIPTRSRTRSRPRPGGGSGPPDAAAGRRGRRGQPPLAGRPDAELQGAAPAPRRVPAGGRAGRLLLDRPGRDRPLVPDARAPRDRRLGRARGLDDPPRPGRWPTGPPRPSAAPPRS